MARCSIRKVPLMQASSTKSSLRRRIAGRRAGCARRLKKISMLAHKNTKLKVRKQLLEALDDAILQDQQHLG